MSRQVISGMLVINEGMAPVPHLKQELQKTIDNLTKIANNQESHLADIGCFIGFQIDRLKNLQDLVFKAHADLRDSIKHSTNV